MNIDEAKKRLQSRRFGVFNHFLYSAPGGDMPTNNSVDWNARCELFDAERVAKDLHDIGAGYYFITLMQGRKYMCAPNATFDEIAGTKPGEACSRRDLIADIAEALAKYDIDLYLYYTGDGPYKDAEIGEKFGFTEPRGVVSSDLAKIIGLSEPRGGVTLEFTKKWASVMEEYAVRYGDKVKGWWIDGCYNHFVYDMVKMTPYYEAAKKGNPSALITMNNGIQEYEGLYNWYCKEDYTSGEFTDFTCIPGQNDIGDAVPHILAPLGISPDGVPYHDWCCPGCKRDGKYLRDYVRRVNEKGGVVTIDIQIRYDSTFDPCQLEALAEINA